MHYTYNDVLISPQYSEVITRSAVDVSSSMGKIKLDVPIISANMKDITGPKMAIEMALNGGMGILHRFNDTEHALEEFGEVISCLKYHPAPYGSTKNLFENPEYHVGVSIGVQEEDKNRFTQLARNGAKVFCIDVAHGHHILMKNMLAYINSQRELYNNDIYVIAGNVATPEGAIDLSKWGADSIKIGIGPGSVCETRKNTGVGVPQLGALDKIRTALNTYSDFTNSDGGKNFPFKNNAIIADGGIKANGDIAKALKFADAVMLGSYLSGTSETPGHVFENEKGQFYKTYGGSASAENKLKSGNKNAFVEGVMTTVPFRGHVKHILRKTKQNLQSSFSYAGARNLKEYQEKCSFIFISSGGRQESKI